MKKLMLTLAGIAALCLVVWAVSSRTITKTGSKVAFTITNAGVEVDGHFNDYQGTIKFDKNDLANSQFIASVKVSSIETGIDKRDEHLRSDDYFDAARYPYMKFTSKKIVAKGSGYEVTGELHIKDVKKTISFPFTAQEAGGKVTLKGKFTIDRVEYHVGTSGWVLGDEVNVDLTIAAQ